MASVGVHLVLMERATPELSAPSLSRRIQGVTSAVYGEGAPRRSH